MGRPESPAGDGSGIRDRGRLNGGPDGAIMGNVVPQPDADQAVSSGRLSAGQPWPPEPPTAIGQVLATGSQRHGTSSRRPLVGRCLRRRRHDDHPGPLGDGPGPGGSHRPGDRAARCSRASTCRSRATSSSAATTSARRRSRNRPRSSGRTRASSTPTGSRPAATTCDAASARVRPGTKLGAGPADRPAGRTGATPSRPRRPREAVDRIAADLAAFVEAESIDHLIVLNVASTEPPFALGDGPPTLGHAQRRAGRRRPRRCCPPARSTPSPPCGRATPTSTSRPAWAPRSPPCYELAESTGRPARRQGRQDRRDPDEDGPGPDVRPPQPEGDELGRPQHLRQPRRRWSSTTRPTSRRRSRPRTGSSRRSSATSPRRWSRSSTSPTWATGRRPGTTSTSRASSGTKMTLQFTWQGCDSLLAAPLAIDLARLADLEKRRGGRGLMRHLASLLQEPGGRRGERLLQAVRAAWSGHVDRQRDRPADSVDRSVSGARADRA